MGVIRGFGGDGNGRDGRDNQRRRVVFNAGELYPGALDNDDIDRIVNDDDSLSEEETVEVPRPANRPPPRSPGTPRRQIPRSGHRLTLKKGRRSRNRFENERALFAATIGDDFDPDEAFGGRDIATLRDEARSRFRTLFEDCNRHILEKFIDGALGLEGEEEEEVAREKKEGIRQQRNVDDDDDDAAAFDPEEAYLKINANLRTAFKKQHQLPLGMVEFLECEIRSFFSANPSADSFTFTGLSSYERLLAHACSAYNALQSTSSDAPAGRMLRVENPSGAKFVPSDPSLAAFLRRRLVASKATTD